MSDSRKFLADESNDDSWKRAQTTELETQVDLTSMIDVTFLLLIFFMVSASLEQTSDVDVPPAEFGVGVAGGAATFVTVLEPLTRDGFSTILLGDGEGPVANDLEEVTESVRAGLAEGRLHVIVKAERRVPHREVQRVFRAAAAVGGVTPHLGVTDKH